MKSFIPPPVLGVATVQPVTQRCQTLCFHFPPLNFNYWQRPRGFFFLVFYFMWNGIVEYQPFSHCEASHVGLSPRWCRWRSGGVFQMWLLRPSSHPAADVGLCSGVFSASEVTVPLFVFDGVFFWGGVSFIHHSSWQLLHLSECFSSSLDCCFMLYFFPLSVWRHVIWSVFVFAL